MVICVHYEINKTLNQQSREAFGSREYCSSALQDDGLMLVLISSSSRRSDADVQHDETDYYYKQRREREKKNRNKTNKTRLSLVIANKPIKS